MSPSAKTQTRENEPRSDAAADIHQSQINAARPTTGCGSGLCAGNCKDCKANQVMELLLLADDAVKAEVATKVDAIQEKYTPKSDGARSLKGRFAKFDLSKAADESVRAVEDSPKEANRSPEKQELSKPPTEESKIQPPPSTVQQPVTQELRTEAIPASAPQLKGAEQSALQARPEEQRPAENPFARQEQAPTREQIPESQVRERIERMEAREPQREERTLVAEAKPVTLGLEPQVIAPQITVPQIAVPQVTVSIATAASPRELTPPSQQKDAALQESPPDRTEARAELAAPIDRPVERQAGRVNVPPESRPASAEMVSWHQVQRELNQPEGPRREAAQIETMHAAAARRNQSVALELRSIDKRRIEQRSVKQASGAAPVSSRNVNGSARLGKDSGLQRGRARGRGDSTQKDRAVAQRTKGVSRDSLRAPERVARPSFTRTIERVPPDMRMRSREQARMQVQDARTSNVAREIASRALSQNRSAAPAVRPNAFSSIRERALSLRARQSGTADLVTGRERGILGSRRAEPNALRSGMRRDVAAERGAPKERRATGLEDRARELKKRELSAPALEGRERERGKRSEKMVETRRDASQRGDKAGRDPKAYERAQQLRALVRRIRDREQGTGRVSRELRLQAAQHMRLKLLSALTRQVMFEINRLTDLALKAKLAKEMIEAFHEDQELSHASRISHVAELLKMLRSRRRVGTDPRVMRLMARAAQLQGASSGVVAEAPNAAPGSGSSAPAASVRSGAGASSKQSGATSGRSGPSTSLDIYQHKTDDDLPPAQDEGG